MLGCPPVLPLICASCFIAGAQPVAARSPQSFPQTTVADYLPGPWAIFFDSGANDPTAESHSAFGSLAEMRRRAPTVDVSLCYVAAAGGSTTNAERRRRLTRVGSILRRIGIARITGRNDRQCRSLDPRSQAMIYIELGSRP